MNIKEILETKDVRRALLKERGLERPGGSAYKLLQRVIQAIADDYGEHLKKVEPTESYIIDKAALKELVDKIFDEIQEEVTYIVEPV